MTLHDELDVLKAKLVAMEQSLDALADAIADVKDDIVAIEYELQDDEQQYANNTDGSEASHN